MKTKLKEVASIQTGVFGKTTAIGEIVYLQSKHFDENGHLLSKLHPDLKLDNTTQKHLLQPGDVLFAAKGTKNFASVYEKHNPLSVASTSFFVIRLFEGKIIPEYLAWIINHPTTQKILKGKAIGTSIVSISKSVLEDLEFSIPDLQTQQTILKISSLRKQEINIQKHMEKLKEQYIQQLLLNAINHD